MSPNARTLAIAAAVLGVLATGCSNSSELVIVMDIGGCRNPGFTQNGGLWLTHDIVPAYVTRGSELRGRLTKHDANTATFVSEDGYELRYSNEGEFRTLECVLSKLP